MNTLDSGTNTGVFSLRPQSKAPAEEGVEDSMSIEQHELQVMSQDLPVGSSLIRQNNLFYIGTVRIPCSTCIDALVDDEVSCPPN